MVIVLSIPIYLTILFYFVTLFFNHSHCSDPAEIHKHRLVSNSKIVDEKVVENSLMNA